jgi:hypothetical protein
MIAEFNHLPAISFPTLEPKKKALFLFSFVIFENKYSMFVLLFWVVI